MRRRLVARVAAVLVGAGWLLQAAAPGNAADAADVKYYVVAASYQGQPETLDEIAGRFLGSPTRAAEIMQSNAGRAQPDGGRLTAPDRLHAGWNLVLPWDAVGDGVRHGPLPQAAPSAGAHPGQTSGAQPTATARAVQCGQTGRKPDGGDDRWGALRVAADQAWPSSRGAGVLVAVVDSGVDGNLSAFRGRISAGTDILSGTGRGDTDCLGSGTALASIVAAAADSGSPVAGVAPDAGVLPVRMVATDAVGRAVDQVAAIEFAARAGARVILLGSHASPADPRVLAAIQAATSRGAVVVVPAPLANPASGVLRVGAMAIDGTLASRYPAGSVDVVAPGVVVAGLGISGVGAVDLTGAQYAAAFVAGAVALVRARFPALTPAEAVHRIEATAQALAGSGFGAGMIDPAAAVTRVLPVDSPAASRSPAPPAAPPRQVPAGALLAIGGLALVTAVVVALRVRRMIRPRLAAPEFVHSGPDQYR